MGVGYSTEYTTESESECPQKPQARAACKVLKLFSSPKEDEILDSTDSEITIEEKRKDSKFQRQSSKELKYLKEKEQESRSPVRRRTSKRESGNNKTIARDSFQVRKKSNQEDSYKNRKSIITNNKLYHINKESQGSKPVKLEDKTSIISLYKKKLDLVESLENNKVLSKHSSLVIPKANITESINKIVNKFSELGVENKDSNIIKSKEPTITAEERRENLLQLDEVMNTYQRYSREPAEKDLSKSSVKNMKSCCCNCNCPSRKFSQQNPCKNRRISDPYVAFRNSLNNEKNPAAIRSAPIELKRNQPSKVPSGKPHIPPPPPLRPQQLACNNKTCPIKNKEMYNYGINKQHYPYEEPSDSTFSNDTNFCHNCNCYDPCQQHRACKCQCSCNLDYCQRVISDDQISCSDSTKTDFMNLAYQRTGDYPELVDELENTLSQRNRIRVQKTMQQFEILSRQNKNLDKPIFDDESVHNLKHNGGKCRDDCRCCKKNENNIASKSSSSPRSDSIPRSNFQPTSFLRKPGYVEKVARCMDPNPNNTSRKYFKSPVRKFINNQNDGNPGTWQMDSRKGEWVKVGPNNSYDFENSYPPLPPRPRSESLYRDEKIRREHEYTKRHCGPDQSCNCHKCRRNR